MYHSVLWTQLLLLTGRPLPLLLSLLLLLVAVASTDKKSSAPRDSPDRRIIGHGPLHYSRLSTSCVPVLIARDKRRSLPGPAAQRSLLVGSERLALLVVYFRLLLDS